MDASRRRTYDLPKSESGLSEWTTKIKALQRQVDEDEENETKKLEEEIRASRMTRMRRSTLQSRPSSVDLPKSPESIRADSPVQNDVVEETPEDRKKNQEAAMRKLIGQRISSAAPSPRSQTTPVKPEPMSLAAFMGSKATGPRMNRPAPQQDAHDSTLFDQRDKIFAPHPIFGRGGVAMPGMTSAAKPHISTPAASVKEEVQTPPPIRERKMSTPSVARKYAEKVEQETVAAQKAGPSYRENIRERTMSTPTGPPASRNTAPATLPKPENFRSPISKSSLPEVRASPASFRNSLSPAAPTPGIPRTPSRTQDTPVHKPSTVTSPPSPVPQRPLSASANSPSWAPRKSSISSPVALAGLVQPSPKPVFAGPQIISYNQSQAFIKPPPSKDVTPSISRLQGRGFVQNMIKVSSKFEAESSGNTNSPPQTPDKLDAKRSVLDRWPAGANTSPPIVSPKPVPIRKTRTFEPSNSSPSTEKQLPPNSIHKQKSQTFTPSVPRTVLPSPSPALSTKFVPVAPSSPEKTQSPAVNAAPIPGVGSSNTMVSYIKPMKTGDSPLTEAPAEAPTPASRPKTPVKSVKFADPSAPVARAKTPVGEVDELGVRKKSSVGKLKQDVGKPVIQPSPRSIIKQTSSPASGQPLSHPTKDRAKRPKKTKPMNGTAVSEASTTKSLLAAFPEPPVAQPRVAPSPSPEPRRPFPVPVAAPSAPVHRFSSEPSPTSSVPQRPPFQSSHSSKVTEKWGNQPVIGVKPMLNGKGGPPSVQQHQPEQNGMTGRIALPGLAITPPSTQTPQAQREERSSRPPTPVRTRIPSTGNRATVMDVAQVWSEHQKGSSADGVPTVEVEEEPPRPDVRAAVANWGAGARSLSPSSPTLPSAEKRKSSLEKYSALAMPALQEMPTPVGTVRNYFPATSGGKASGVEKGENADVKHRPIDVLHTSMNSGQGLVNMRRNDLVHFDNPSEPLPEVDVEALSKAHPVAGRYIVNKDALTVSVDVMSVAGSNSTAITKETSVFYDTEVLAIIHRFKLKSTGLMETKVWGWLGRNSTAGERELKALADLAKRYGTRLIAVKQYCEPVDLVSVLGGQLAIRQGSRAHWSSENTSMHLVRDVIGSLFVDELDLSIQNLCSGFSYCISILQTFYVWHGCGSLPSERKAALDYAQGLSGDPGSITELKEGENDDDEMFWMILGDDSYAKAQYWKWKPEANSANPRVWKVEHGAKDNLKPISYLTEENAFEQNVFVLDCVWELFVLVGSEARGKRQDIRIALAAATGLASRSHASKPFVPTVHVLILPTQLPLDLRIWFRDINEENINGGSVPEHMNILPMNQALEHLERRSWDKVALKDKKMLPLGLHETDLS